MICIFETLPNEVLLIIFSYLSWLEMLTSLWSLNHRINSLLCSILSINDNKEKNGVIMKGSDLSYNEYYSRLLSLRNHSSSVSFCSCIQRMCFDGTNPIACDINFEWIFDQNNDKKILHFSNLKSLTVIQCWLSESLIQNLSLLIQGQLDDLTLTFNDDMFNSRRYGSPIARRKHHKKKLMNMFKNFLRQLFSSQCQLSSLRLDIGRYEIGYDTDDCIKLFSHSYQNSISSEFQSFCTTLSRLYIHIRYAYFLEHLIEHIPTIEKLSIKFTKTLDIRPRSMSFIEKLGQANGNWFNKVPKLRHFILKTFIRNDLEFVYLKWLLNNLNHVQKLKPHLGSNELNRTDQIIWKSLIDANFVRQYCLPDIINSIIDFDFYISSHCRLLPNDVEKVINSFKFHPLFIDCQWTNVKCFYEPIISYQHLFSTNVNASLRFFNSLVSHSYLFEWPNIRHISIDFHPSLYIFLEQLHEVFPNASSITVYMEHYRNCNQSNLQLSLTKLFETGLHKVTDIHFQNITKLKFGHFFTRLNYTHRISTDRDKERAKVLAHLISMPIQLKELLVERFEWLLHIIEYALNHLKTTALSTVRYVEFCIPSCRNGSNESINIGKYLVPFLMVYMPHLRTLCLWRPDDFPWTTIRPNLPEGHFRMVLLQRWMKSLHTSKSIAKHVTVFEDDLCQLVEQLKQLVFLDIYGEISYEKVDAYHSMVQTHYSDSRSYISTSRFCLWL